MTTKLDAPKSRGELTYTNTGSCSRLINYQISNKEKLGDNNEFFTLNKDNISSEDARLIIDYNVKGLKKDEEKFYSFSINPSTEELAHINNDKTKLKSYVKEVMSNYAINFNKKEITNKDLVWTAIIHDTRYYTHEDLKKAKDLNEEIKFKIGDKKPGNNMHVHVIVSRQNSGMNKTLTIRGRKGKDNFSLFDFQKMNQDKFQTFHNYKIGINLYGEMQTKAILKGLHEIEQKMPLSDKEVLNIAAKQNFSGQVNYNIKDLIKSINRGEAINDPYKFIEVGKKEYNKLKNSQEFTKELMSNISTGFEEVLSILSSGNTNERNKGEIPDISEYNKKHKKKRKLIL